jgi:hypothetical protein
MAVAAIAATKERILSVKKECGAESYLLDVLSFLRAFIRPVLESARRKRAIDLKIGCEHSWKKHGFER